MCGLVSSIAQAILDENDKHILDQVAKGIIEVHKLCLEHGTPPLIVLVEGHTNCTDPAKRSNSFHIRLSEERAAACRAYVESKGAPASKDSQT